MKSRAFISKRIDGSYIPYDDHSRELLNKVKDNQCIEVKIANSRLLWFHRRFFLALQFIYENLPEQFKEMYPTQESLRKVLLKLSGHTEEIIMPDGRIQIETKSINFEKVKQDEFEQIYSAFIDSALKYFITDFELQEKLINLT